MGRAGNTCSTDSSCTVAGIVRLLVPEIEWLSDSGMPFGYWQYPCGSGDIDSETHITGPGNLLYAITPSPFFHSASIRFHLARDSRAKVKIFDVTGRLVHLLLDADLEMNAVKDAGHHEMHFCCVVALAVWTFSAN